MARTRSVQRTDTAGLDRLLTPRDDVLVREAAGPRGDGTAELHATEGPFRAYRRTLAWEDDPAAPGTLVVRQEVTYRLAVPYWAWLYRPVAGPALRDGIPHGVRPWWSFPDRLSPAQSSLVATMTACNVVAGLLFGMVTQVLTFVAADLGDGSRSQQAAVLSIIRLGVVVTMGAMVLADRVGRRRVALWGFWLSLALTAATAAAPSLAAVTLLQALSRNLAVAALLAVDTIAMEELPAGSRAMATGLGALAYGLGAGIVVLSLPLADLGAGGWRLVFLVSLLAVPLLWDASRRLPESARFRRLAEHVDTGERRRIRGGRLVLLGTMFFLLNLFVAPASQLQNDYLRTERGFSGALMSVFIVLTSTPGAVGVVVGGRWADTRGRRSALIPGLLAIGGFTALFFAVAGPAMWVASLLSSVLGGLAVASLGVLGPELFPTARRGSARGMLTGIAVGGAVVGLLGAGALVDRSGYGPTFALLALGPLVAAGLALAVPETRGRELEDLNRADAGPGVPGDRPAT